MVPVAARPQRGRQGAARQLLVEEREPVATQVIESCARIARSRIRNQGVPMAGRLLMSRDLLEVIERDSFRITAKRSRGHA